MKPSLCKKILIGSLLTMSATLASSAFANIPAITDKCKSKLPQIALPNRGVQPLFDEDCTTAFVPPPETGEARLSTIARNSNLQFCPAVLKVGSTAESLVSTAASIADRLEKMVKDYEPVVNEIEGVAKSLNDAQAELQRVQSLVNVAEEKKREALTDLASAKSDLETCQVLGNDCTDATRAKQAAELAYISAKHEFDTQIIEKINREAQVSRLSSEKLRLETLHSDSTASMVSLLSQIESINSTVFDLYRSWAPLEGATAQLVYRINWKKMMDDFIAKNPRLVQSGIRIAPVSIVDGKFFAMTKLKSDDSDLATLPAVLTAVVPGAVAAYGPAAAGDNVSRVEASDTDASNAANTPVLNESMLAFSAVNGGGTSVSGQVRLSLTGACPYFPKGKDSPDRREISQQELVAHLVVNAELSYDVAVQRKYKAQFNLSKVAERIEEVARKKKWFFTSQDAHKLTVENEASSWFKIDFDVDSSDFDWTPQEQQKLSQEVKADLVKRTLDQIATITGKIPDVPSSSKTGVESAPKFKCPSFYCQAFNYLVAVGDGLFSSKNAVSKFKETNKSWSTDIVAQQKVVRRSQILTFEAR